MKNIDFRNGRPLVMMVSQYDYGYNLQVALWSNGTPVTITAAEIVSENFTTTCTFSGNVVTIPVTTSMTEQFGHFPAELRVTDSTGQVSSKNFDFFVERSPLAVKSTETYSGDIVEFTAKRVPLSSVVVTMEPIQSGSGDPSPTNVRPITGRTGASVVVSGKNLLKPPSSGGTIAGITYVINNDRTVVANGTTSNSSSDLYFIGGTSTYENINIPSGDYILTGCGTTATVGRFYIIEEGSTPKTQTNDVPLNITLDSTKKYRMFIRILSGQTVVNQKYEMMLRPATDTDDTYAPYKSTTYPLTFTSAGTVYAGTVDLVSGVLTVTHAGMTIDETMNISTESTRFYVGQNNCKRQTNYSPETVRCDRLPTVAYEEEINFGSPGVTAYRLRSNFPGRNWIYFSSGDANITTVAQMKEWLSDNPLQVVYELVEPLTYNLTPTQVMSLLGENFMWSPDGEVTVVVPEYY